MDKTLIRDKVLCKCCKTVDALMTYFVLLTRAPFCVVLFYVIFLFLSLSCSC